MLHVPGHDPVPEVDRLLDGYAAAEIGALVKSAVTGADGYDTRGELDDDKWLTLAATLTS